MPEEMLSSEERNAILSQVIAQPGPKEGTTVKKSNVVSEKTTDLSQLSFGELLEKTLEQRGEMDKEDSEGVKKIDEAREQAIVHSRFDILKDWHL